MREHSEGSTALQAVNACGHLGPFFTQSDYKRVTVLDPAKGTAPQWGWEYLCNRGFSEPPLRLLHSYKLFSSYPITFILLISLILVFL